MPLPEITIYTDGASLGNPGPGGYAAIVIANGRHKELSDGFRRTTNNRMELIAAIVGLKYLKSPSQVILYSDSKYLVDGMNQGWARQWRAKGFKKKKNPDLWIQLLDLCERHDVKFKWVEGHAGHPENERCDQLSVQAARRPGLPPDEEYERSEMEQNPPTLF
jgi:ribonuclease HI